MNIVITARESFLFKNGVAYVKKSRSDRFDIPMGSWDGAEVSELCGIYLLDKITNKDGPFEKSWVGLYRYDGLGIAKGNDSTRDKIRKQIETIFKEEGLKITTEINMVKTDFLDVRLDIETFQYRPYQKPGDTPSYINVMSNHPPNCFKHVPKTVEKRISNHSSTKEIFECG